MRAARSTVVRTSLRVLEVPALGRWSARWDELAASAEVASPFLRTWWLEAVGASAGTPLYVLVLDGDELVGGIALETVRQHGVRRYRLLGQGTLCPDHLDLVADPTRLDDVCTRLAGWWATVRGVIDLDGIAEGARLLTTLPAQRVTTAAVAPYEPLTDFPGYLAARSRNTRKAIRSKMRRLDRDGLQTRLIGPDELPGALDDFVAMHQARGDRTRLLREFGRVAAALRAGVERGEAWVQVIEGPRGRLAVSISLLAGTRCCHYQLARWRSPDARDTGTLLDVASIERACVEGLTEFDLLRGDEPYKSSLVARKRTVWRVRWARGSAGRLLLTARLALEAARSVCVKGPDGTRWRVS